jgi:hypothetical protein
MSGSILDTYGAESANFFTEFATKLTHSAPQVSAGFYKKP